jgi:hypothetical protein
MDYETDNKRDSKFQFSERTKADICKGLEKED